MPTLSAMRQKGFSLLEIMIVIVIIGVGAATIRLAIVKQDPLDEVVKTANAFSFWFGNQLDESLLTNSEVGLYFTESGVALLTWREGDVDNGEEEIVWEVVSEVDYATGFDELKVELLLDIESQQWIQLEQVLPEDTAEIAAHILLFPSEDYQPSFILIFSHRDYADESVHVMGDGFNRLVVTRETI